MGIRQEICEWKRTYLGSGSSTTIPISGLVSRFSGGTLDAHCAIYPDGMTTCSAGRPRLAAGWPSALAKEATGASGALESR